MYYLDNTIFIENVYLIAGTMVFISLLIFYIGYRMGRWSIKNMVERECARYCRTIDKTEMGDKGQKSFARNLITHFKNTIIISTENSKKWV